MVGIVVAAHGSLASAFLQTVEMIVGQQPGVAAVGFEPGQAIKQLQAAIVQAVEAVDGGDGVLILVDVLAGSPWQAAAFVALHQPGVAVVAGVNMPMLLEVLPQRQQSLAAVVDLACRIGSEGICPFAVQTEVPG